MLDTISNTLLCITVAVLISFICAQAISAIKHSYDDSYAAELEACEYSASIR